jgi:hypothetical protein
MPKIYPKLWSGFLLLSILSGTVWAQLPVTDDSYISSGSSTLQGTNPSLAVQSPTASTLMKLDLSRLPAGTTASQITKATVKLYPTAVAVGGNIDVCEVSGTWSEKTVVYSSKPALGGPHLIVAGPVAIPTGSAGKYVILDITPAVKDWLSGTPNNGLVIMPSNSCVWGSSSSTISATFDSKESTTTSHDPELNVVLALTNGTVTSVGTGVGLTGGPITTSGTISLVPATSASLGGVIVPTCAANTHFSGIDGIGNLTCTADSVSSINFSAILSGTNLGQSLVVGNGSSLSVIGSGHITADLFSGNITESQVTNLTSDLGTETTARIAGDASTLSSAKSYTDAQVLSEAVARAAGDTAAIASAATYTDAQVATINTSLTGKANLAGGNSFSGNQSVTGNVSITGNGTVSGILGLPATAVGNSMPSFPLDFKATGNAGASETFRLLSDGTGVTPVLDLQSCSGTGCTPVSTGLFIDNTGKITFAAGQTFPGSGSVTNVATGTGLTGGPITSAGTISLVPANTSSAIGGVKGAACAANNHYSSIAGDGTLNCTTDATTTSLSFSSITSGANATALTVGTGGSLNVSGTGTINATSLSGELAATSATAGTIAARDGTGNLTATQFSGSGAGLTNLNASNISTGTVPSANLPVATSSAFGAVRPTIVNAVTNNVNLKNTTLSFAVNCAAGRFVFGGGVNTDVTTQVMVMASYPSAAGTWTATLQGMNNNAAQTVQVTVYAVCSGN